MRRRVSKGRPPGAKAPVILEALRGAEAPLFHGAESPLFHGAESPLFHGAEAPLFHGTESPLLNGSKLPFFPVLNRRCSIALLADEGVIGLNECGTDGDEEEG